MSDTFTQRALRMIKRVPKGKVATYGQIAALSGSPRGARQVVRLLHTLSDKEKLPWHRIINKQGRISLTPGAGYELQKALLESEDILFDRKDSIDLNRFLWKPASRKRSP